MPDGDLREVIGSMKFDDMWHDADLLSAFEYVRNSKLLRIPPEFCSMIPRFL